MSQSNGWPSAAGDPRVVLLGSYRDALGLSAEGFVRALASEAHVEHVDGSSPVRDAVRMYRGARSLLAHEACELVHVLDPRFAPVGALLRRRFGVPATVTLSPALLRSPSPWARLARRSLSSFDEAFAGEEAAATLARERVPDLPLSLVRPGARELPWPSAGDVTRVARALRGVQPGRLVVGVPWPPDRNDFRWFRDLVMPQLKSRPLCLLFGVNSRREARFMLRAAGTQSDFRVLSGPITGSLISAIARTIDAFALPVSTIGTRVYDAEQSLALAVAGPPVVSHATARDLVLTPDAGGLAAWPDDDHTFITALDRLLGLHPIQRQFLGEDMARAALHERPWRPAAEAYVERFAALLGRPRIPAGLRAA